MNIGLFVAMLVVFFAASLFAYETVTMLSVITWFLCVGAIVWALAYADYREVSRLPPTTGRKVRRP